MSVRIYPEWFVDGPWHGEDKRKRCPHLQGIVRCAMVRPFNVRELLSTDLAGADMIPEPTFDEYTYIPKWVDVFGERLCVWVSETNAGNIGGDWVRMLGQLIMFPHRLDGDKVPYNVGPIAERHRDRWDIEHEVRREVRREISEAQQTIRRLEDDIRRLRTANVLASRPTNPFKLMRENSARIALRDDEDTLAHVEFDNIVLYFDEGDGTEKNPPSWVATAQGPVVIGSDHQPPCTGYGTTKKAAIIALLADGLGVYARMIEIGERMK